MVRTSPVARWDDRRVRGGRRLLQSSSGRGVGFGVDFLDELAIFSVGRQPAIELHPHRVTDRSTWIIRPRHACLRPFWGTSSNSRLACACQKVSWTCLPGAGSGARRIDLSSFSRLDLGPEYRTCNRSLGRRSRQTRVSTWSWVVELASAWTLRRPPRPGPIGTSRPPMGA